MGGDSRWEIPLPMKLLSHSGYWLDNKSEWITISWLNLRTTLFELWAIYFMKSFLNQSDLSELTMTNACMRGLILSCPSEVPECKLYLGIHLQSELGSLSKTSCHDFVHRHRKKPHVHQNVHTKVTWKTVLKKKQVHKASQILQDMKRFEK